MAVATVPNHAWPPWPPLLFLLLLPAGSSGGCPAVCDCTSQPRAVLCAHRRLEAVPGGLPLDTELLDLSGNRLWGLQRGMLSRLGLLRELDLSYNQLSTLEPGAFQGLQSLLTLRLQGNRLRIMGPGVFSGLSALTLLDLRLNQLVLFLDGAFRELGSLQQHQMPRTWVPLHLSRHHVGPPRLFIPRQRNRVGPHSLPRSSFLAFFQLYEAYSMFSPKNVSTPPESLSWYGDRSRQKIAEETGSGASPIRRWHPNGLG